MANSFEPDWDKVNVAASIHGNHQTSATSALKEYHSQWQAHLRAEKAPAVQLDCGSLADAMKAADPTPPEPAPVERALIYAALATVGEPAPAPAPDAREVVSREDQWRAKWFTEHQTCDSLRRRVAELTNGLAGRYARITDLDAIVAELNTELASVKRERDALERDWRRRAHDLVQERDDAHASLAAIHELIGRDTHGDPKLIADCATTGILNLKESLQKAEAERDDWRRLCTARQSAQEQLATANADADNWRKRAEEVGAALETARGECEAMRAVCEAAYTYRHGCHGANWARLRDAVDALRAVQGKGQGDV